MTGGLTRRGGAGGVHANLEDMRSTSERLVHTEGTFVRAGGESARHMTSGALARTAILTPGTAMQVQVALGQAAASAGALVVGVAAQAFVLRARADLFQLADEAASRVSDLAEDIFAIPVVVGVAVAVGVFGPGVLSRFPGATDVVTGGMPTVLERILERVLPGGDFPGDVEGVIGMLQGIAGLGGHGVDRRVGVKRGAEACTNVNGLKDVLTGVVGLEQSQAGQASSAVRITKLDGQPPRWIVEIPGTLEWNPKAGANPSDLTSNAQLMQRKGELMAAIREAMHQAGIPPGEQVMVAGHSQGGIAAAALAGDPVARREFNITNVLTAGSPVGHMDIPRDVQVISIEHEQDPVPRLESEDNPDRANWTTFTRDVGGEPGVSQNPIAAHSGALYAETAGMIPKEDRTSFDEFTGNGTSVTYELRR